MEDTIARWSWRDWNYPTSLRDLSRSAFCFLFPHQWLKRRLADRRWDETEMNFLDVMVDPQRAALDIGANSGKYAARLSALARKVYAFEPDRALAAKIGRALPRNVEVHAAAVSNRQGVARLMFPVIAGERATALASIEPGVLGEAETVSFEVPTIRLDDFAREPIGFMKIDVEGHEMSVLEGAEGLIARERPVIMVEAEERHRRGAVASVRSFMGARGFDGFFILGDSLKNIDQLTPEMQSEEMLALADGLTQMVYVNNFIFVPKEKAAAFAQRMEDALDRAPHAARN